MSLEQVRNDSRAGRGYKLQRAGPKFVVPSPCSFPGHHRACAQGREAPVPSSLGNVPYPHPRQKIPSATTSVGRELGSCLLSSLPFPPADIWAQPGFAGKSWAWACKVPLDRVPLPPTLILRPPCISHRQCCSGRELVDGILALGLGVHSRSQAVGICQVLLDEGALCHGELSSDWALGLGGRREG